MNSTPTPFRLAGQTQFCVAIRDPISGRIVTAEQLYNDACRGMGRIITDHIADLVFDNLVYPVGGLGRERDEQLCREVRGWEKLVHAKLAERVPEGWGTVETFCPDSPTYPRTEG